MRGKQIFLDKGEKQKGKKTNRRDINKGYLILYLSVIIFIFLGEIALYCLGQKFSLEELVQDTIGNLMGVLAAFLIFDIAHEKITKDSYASEVSEQILDTMMYHPDALSSYENEQKKIFVSAFIDSIVEDLDAAEMINNHLKYYLLTEKDFRENTSLTEKDCRIRTSFSYRFVLDRERTNAFSALKALDQDEKDPYFYVQEELNYKVKYLASKGNYTNKKEVKIGFIYDNAELDRFLRGNNDKRVDGLLQNCLFRESLDIEDVDKEMIQSLANEKEKLVNLIITMFRPNLTIDRCKGEVVDVQVIANSGLIVVFRVDHDIDAMEHTINIVFHMPKKWDTVVEVVLVEPTKEPHISLSYNEDAMDVEMYSFLNKGEASSYENAAETENGIYSMALVDEWVFPVSGTVFTVKRAKPTKK